MHVWVAQKGRESRRAIAGSLHGIEHPAGALQGTLYLMCGGQPEAFERARPVLEKLGSTVRYVGEAGKAAQVKALVNMVMNINTAGLAEGLGLGAALGLDLSMLREVFSQTGANSAVLRSDGEDMQNRDVTPAFFCRACREGILESP